jgi:DNA polymerase III alpha subunit
MYVPLHTKSEHSPGYGTASVGELLDWAHSKGCLALALTDVENLYGQVKGREIRSGYEPRALG